jgi:hypothetical protein
LKDDDVDVTRKGTVHIESVDEDDWLSAAKARIFSQNTIPMRVNNGVGLGTLRPGQSAHDDPQPSLADLTASGWSISITTASTYDFACKIG